MNKLISMLLTATSLLFAAESQVDLRIDTDPNDLQGKSSFHVTSTTGLISDCEKHAFLFTPEMNFYSNNGIDFSVSTGHRHRYKNMVWGHTVFFDRSNLEGKHLDQVGTGFDLQTPHFDFRTNYYHPVTNYRLSPISACKWVDGEIFFKTPYFGVGTGPMYNVDMQAWALHSRIVIPMDKISINFGAICGGGEYGQSQAVLSISFHIFKPRNADALISPACHVQKSNLYYNSGYSFEKASPLERMSGKIKLNYNPNIVTYIEQIEDEITFQEKNIKENNDG